ncbi:tyrosine-type recombinase/integrase [Formosa algae]|uniref:Integrase n=1 Tax=Formosa algae TaxID=225843 RepID=A0A9X1CCM1_9FLAO|nr:phage integrase SAM-like domain-containing protein [Formosa algae]MBP1840395.1 integrase [Formosa algae]MDQ0336887.1 integrase [Formosa algae]OEI79539.1 hypothetical protein AST99_13890 [Formosa algae]
MATINFLFRSTRKKAPLTARLLFRDENKEDYTLSAKTKYFVDAEYWKNHTKKKCNEVADFKNKQFEVNAELQKIENFIIDAFNNENITEVTKDWFENQMHLYYNPIDEVKQSDILTDAIQSIIDEAETRKNAKGGIGLSKSRINNLVSLKKTVAEYQGKNKLKVKDINVNFGKDFLKFLLEKKKYQKSTALKKVADLKTVCNDAELNGIETNIQYKKINSTKPNNENILYLSPLELEKISNAELTKDAHLNARKWLLLGCNLGQRGNDLLQLNENNFVTRNGYEVIELKQQKTDKNVTIPVLETTKEIIKSGLPYHISIQKFNKHIKEICKEANIDEKIQGSKITVIEKGKGNTEKRKINGLYPKWELMSSHVCRRSFATNLYGTLPTPLIMQITAHSSEKMLLNYIGKSALDYAQQIADFYTLQAIKENKENPMTVIKNVSNQN